MRSFLLLFLWLMTGCGTKTKVKGKDGWSEFTCKYPENSTVSLRPGRQNEKLRLIIEQLREPGTKFCKDVTKTAPDKIMLVVDGYRMYTQTDFGRAKTSVWCNYTADNHEKSVEVCREKKSHNKQCKQFSSTKSDSKFILTQTSHGFNVSVSHVSKHNAGVLWCGVVPSKGNKRAAFKEVQLEVKEIIDFTRPATVGQDFSYYCKCSDCAGTDKFICKGDDPSTCQRLASTAVHKMDSRFSMVEHEMENITIIVRNITADDKGTYWCRGERADGTPRKPLYHRFIMTLKQPATVSVLPAPVSPTRSPTSTAAASVGSGVVIPVIICVAVLLLLLGLISVLIYKRFLQSRKTRSGAAAEDYIYAEIQERVQKPDSTNTACTIYATATNCPTNPSASLHYSTLNFKKSSDKGGRDKVVVKPSSSGCEYTTVRHSQSLASPYSPNPPQDPLYSTVNMHRGETDSEFI